MRRDKFVSIQEPIMTLGATGGTREIYVNYWTGWVRVDELAYSTSMEEGQYVGNKMIRIQIWKNAKTDKINTAMRIDYRSNTYLINSIRELDRFTLEVTGMIKEIPNVTLSS
jgi:head-tail adaptor